MRKGRLFLILFNVLGLLLAAFLISGILASLRMRSRLDDGHFFALKDGRYVSVNPLMVRQEFDAEKDPAEFRIFVLGYSQAMGSPYVHQDNDRVADLFNLLVMPNEGGISTWLKDYFSLIYPGRKIKVVNAALALTGFETGIGVYEQVLKEGKPDLVVLLTHVRRVVDDKERRALSRSLLDRAVSLADSTGTEVYALTVPSNIRDWVPDGPQSPSVARAIELCSSGQAAQGFALLGKGRPASAPEFYARAKCLDASGDYEKARAMYIAAKDAENDPQRNRPPSYWNDMVRGIPKGGKVRPLDMERLFFALSPQGIPGFNFFHDYIHLTLRGNAIAAREIALFYAREHSLPTATADALYAYKPALYGNLRLKTLYALKALKWLRSSYHAENDAARQANTGAVSRRYLLTPREECDMLDYEINFRKQLLKEEAAEKGGQ